VPWVWVSTIWPHPSVASAFWHCATPPPPTPGSTNTHIHTPACLHTLTRCAHAQTHTHTTSRCSYCRYCTQPSTTPTLQARLFGRMFTSPHRLCEQCVATVQHVVPEEDIEEDEAGKISSLTRVSVSFGPGGLWPPACCCHSLCIGRWWLLLAWDRPRVYRQEDVQVRCVATNAE
jgi:hypothetical protein